MLARDYVSDLQDLSSLSRVSRSLHQIVRPTLQQEQQRITDATCAAIQKISQHFLYTELYWTDERERRERYVEGPLRQPPQTRLDDLQKTIRENARHVVHVDFSFLDYPLLHTSLMRQKFQAMASDAIGRFLSSSSNLRQLSFGNPDRFMFVPSRLFEAVSLEKLEILDLSGCSVSAPAIRRLSQSVRSLQVLKCTGNGQLRTEGGAFWEWVCEQKSLKHLEVNLEVHESEFKKWIAQGHPSVASFLLGDIEVHREEAVNCPSSPTNSPASSRLSESEVLATLMPAIHNRQFPSLFRLEYKSTKMTRMAKGPWRLLAHNLSSSR